MKNNFFLGPPHTIHFSVPAWRSNKTEQNGLCFVYLPATPHTVCFSIRSAIKNTKH